MSSAFPGDCRKLRGLSRVLAEVVRAVCLSPPTIRRTLRERRVPRVSEKRYRHLTSPRASNRPGTQFARLPRVEKRGARGTRTDADAFRRRVILQIRQVLVRLLRAYFRA